jgi:hypothetical protein
VSIMGWIFLWTRYFVLRFRNNVGGLTAQCLCLNLAFVYPDDPYRYERTLLFERLRCGIVHSE